MSPSSHKSSADTVQSQTRPRSKAFANLPTNEKHHMFFFSPQVANFGSLRRQRTAQTVMETAASERASEAQLLVTAQRHLSTNEDTQV